MDPGNWTRGHFSLENINYSLHETLSPSNPFSIPEAQAGAADFWYLIHLSVMSISDRG